MNISAINLINYDLTVLEYSEFNDASMIPARQFRMKFGSMADPKIEQLMKDMVLMNAVRGSSSEAVKVAFEQLLTLLALAD